MCLLFFFDALDQEIFFCLTFLVPSGSEEVCVLITYETFRAARRVTTCPGANAGRAGGLFKKQVVKHSSDSLATSFLSCCF